MSEFGSEYDLAIIGGGINGTAIARDAAGRGLRVLLVEQNDLASGTSSTSSKLIHGGLRYLEQMAFRMVQEGLHERATLLRTAPHLVWPARFVLPHHSGLRPAWMLRIGLYLYDFLAGSNSLVPPSTALDLSRDVSGKVLQKKYHRAFEYSDCCVDDARLVVLNAVDAAQRGAVIRTRTRFTGASRQAQHWQIKTTSRQGEETYMAKALVNAAGPWLETVSGMMPRDTTPAHVKLVKGSHIVVRKLFDHDKCYIFQNGDGRIVFAIPYQSDFTLIGTTDIAFSGDAADAKASDEEITYLIALANAYFKQRLSPKDVVWSFAGVRALCDARSLAEKNLSRDFVLQLDGDQQSAPLLSIYGGKLTAARHLAEAAMDKLRHFLPMRDAWTAHIPLIGGDFKDFSAFRDELHHAYPFLATATATRLARAYGTRAQQLLGNAKSMDDLGILFGADLTEREVRYLLDHEWAQNAEDILWRRSKMGLHLNHEQQATLAAFIAKEQR